MFCVSPEKSHIRRPPSVYTILSSVFVNMIIHILQYQLLYLLTICLLDARLSLSTRSCLLTLLLMIIVEHSCVFSNTLLMYEL